MKVLQVNKYYYPDIGGVETVVSQYAQALKNLHKVKVLCIHKNFTFKTVKESIDGVEIVRCSSFGTFMSMPLSVSFFYHFFKLYKSHDLFHFHEPFPLASLLSLFISSKRKIVVTWHSDIIKQKSLKRLVEVFQSHLCKKASIITTTSPNLLKFSKVLKKFENKVSILPLGINLNPIDEKLSKGEYILCLGRLSYYKGIDVLLQAYLKAKTRKELFIVGDGDKDIVELITKYQNKSTRKIKFINQFVSEEEKRNLLKKCLFFVFPSIAASEAFGIIQLEAMSYGKPVINTNLPTGVPFVSLDNVTGITVEPSNIIELAQAIDKLSFDNQLVDLMGENAKKRVISHFSNVKIMTKLLRIYDSL
ncbi:glycosyltransferase [Maribacter dokdonensis]|uniref:glycosyltransferase n=1 Tax=Maribacter dokdonensis TaxID=320912 RepID=UPI002733F385|nr:glycosyltransferase [Maribacter dokdonensis]MDP2526695.1 glycosyltransferase [Maribacter dokdonensis]